MTCRSHLQGCWAAAATRTGTPLAAECDPRSPLFNAKRYRQPLTRFVNMLSFPVLLFLVIDDRAMPVALQIIKTQTASDRIDQPAAAAKSADWHARSPQRGLVIAQGGTTVTSARNISAV
jgi:hypothetical protein